MEPRTALAIELQLQPNRIQPTPARNVVVPLGEVICQVEPIGQVEWRDVRAGDWVAWTAGPYRGDIDVIAAIELVAAIPPQPRAAITCVRDWEETGESVAISEDSPSMLLME